MDDDNGGTVSTGDLIALWLGLILLLGAMDTTGSRPYDDPSSPRAGETYFE